MLGGPYQNVLRSVPFYGFYGTGAGTAGEGVKGAVSRSVLIRNGVQNNSKFGAVPCRFSEEKHEKTAFFAVMFSVPYSTETESNTAVSVRNGMRYGGVGTKLNSVRRGCPLSLSQIDECHGTYGSPSLFFIAQCAAVSTWRFPMIAPVHPRSTFTAHGQLPSAAGCPPAT